MPKLGISIRAVAAIIVAGTTAVYGLAVYLPTHRQIGSLRAEIREHERTIDQGEELAVALRLAEERRDAAAQFIARWKQDAPRKGETYSAFAIIQELADRAGLKTTRFDPQPPIPYETLQWVPVTYSFRGLYPQLHSFLWGVDGLSHTIWIDRLVMTDIGEDGDELRCEVTLAVFADNREDSD